ncbi:MAG: cyclic pyranopterin monophosphate synthase MoaC, partial [Planctomycetota bacterium]
MPSQPDSLTHLDDNGDVQIVDISEKPSTLRVAVAEGRVDASPKVLCSIDEGTIAKGPVLQTARLAAIAAVKRTAETIPLCHPIAISGIDLDFQLTDRSVLIRCRVKTNAATGVEMEALCGVSAAALTIIDMAKSIDRGMRIRDVRVVEKSGGKSGTHSSVSDFDAPQANPPSDTDANAEANTDKQSKAAGPIDGIVPPIRVAIATISDRCSRGERQDRSGPALAEVVRQRLPATIVHST